MKNIFYVVFIICSCVSFSQEQLTGNEINREELLLLAPLTEYNDVIARFGEPDALWGAYYGTAVKYTLPDGRSIVLIFGFGDELGEKLFALIIEITKLDEEIVIFDLLEERRLENFNNRHELFLLELYTPAKDIIYRFGVPDVEVGSGSVIFQYILKDGRRIEADIANSTFGDLAPEAARQSVDKAMQAYDETQSI